MDLQRFFALRTGASTLPDGHATELIVEELGTLKMPSGRLAIADTTQLDTPVVVQVPAGEYAVRLTRAKVDERYDLAMRREAFISLILSDAETVEVGPAPVEAATREWREEPTGGIAGVADLHGVSTEKLGSITLADADAIRPGMPGEPSSWYDSVISVGDGTGWFEQMDSESGGPIGTVNAEFPEATDGTNAVTIITRPHKLFPLLATRDAAGGLTGIHVDLLVIGELSEKLNAFDGVSPHAAAYFEHLETAQTLREKAEPQKRGGLLGWLRGR